MSKKGKNNAFMNFVMDWKKDNPHISLPNAISEVNPIWQKMSAEERQPYKDMSRQGKIAAREKLDCVGRKLTVVAKEREDAEQALRAMKRAIENTVKNSVRKKELETQKYYFIMVNYFTKKNDGLYVPAELAISQFSLKEGVHRKHHTLINPNVDLLGYLYQALSHTEESHMLPLPPKALGDSNCAAIYKDIIEFVRDASNQSLPPLYTHRDHIEEVKSVLGYLQSFAAPEDNYTLDIYSIHHLFFVLKEACAEIGETDKPSSSFVTDAHFERDFFDYEPDIACQFHEDLDRSKHCALSYVVRWGFLFGDYMCHDLGIIPKPGCHVPASTQLASLTIPNEAEKNKEREAKGFTSNVSKPDDAWEERWANAAPPNPGAAFKHDFPALGARKKNQSMTNTTMTDLDPDMSSFDMNNPWSARSRREKPREPDNSVFDINFSNAASDFEEPIAMPNFGRGKGRGKLFQL